MKESMNLKELKNSDLLAVIFVDNLERREFLNETLFSISKQTNKPDLAVLYSGLNEEQLNELKEMLNQPQIIVRKTDKEGKLQEEIVKTDPENINFVLVPTEAKTFPQIFNEGFNLAWENGYELYSVVEREDIIAINWYEYAKIYSDENEDLGIFLPIARNIMNGQFNGILNEAPWAEGMAEEAGKLDMNLLNRFNCSVPLGAVYRVKAIKEYSQQKEEKYYPYKESIRLAHYYEFFLRMIYNDIKAIVVPRFGYELKMYANNNFKESSTKIPQNITTIPIENGGITPEEAKFWMDLVKKEYFFDEDREKKYEAITK